MRLKLLVCSQDAVLVVTRALYNVIVEGAPQIDSAKLDAYWQLQTLFDCKTFDKEYAGMNVNMENCKKLQSLVHSIQAVEDEKKDGQVPTSTLMHKPQLLKQLQRELVSYNVNWDGIEPEVKNVKLEKLCDQMDTAGKAVLHACATQKCDVLLANYKEEFDFINKYKQGVADGDFRTGMKPNPTWTQYCKHVKDVGMRSCAQVAELETKVSECAAAHAVNCQCDFCFCGTCKFTLWKQRCLGAKSLPTVNPSGSPTVIGRG